MTKSTLLAIGSNTARIETLGGGSVAITNRSISIIEGERGNDASDFGPELPGPR